MKDNITYGEKYDPAMKVTTKEEAVAYLKVCMEHTVRVRPDVAEEEARSIELQNIGYYAGYYDRETFKRVTELYETAHPIFGNDSNMYDTPEKALELGKQRGNNE